MWQRFTERARRAIFFAREEAERLGSNAVDVEHLLLGVLREDDTVACRILARQGVSVAAMRQDVRQQCAVGDRPADAAGPQLAPLAKRAVDLAYDEARQIGNNYIGTEHLLLALVRQCEGIAGRVIGAYHLQLEAVRHEVFLLQENDTGTPSREHASERLAAELSSLTPHEAAGLREGAPIAELPQPLQDALAALLRTSTRPLASFDYRDGDVRIDTYDCADGIGYVVSATGRLTITFESAKPHSPPD